MEQAAEMKIQYENVFECHRDINKMPPRLYFQTELTQQLSLCNLQGIYNL